MCYFILFVLNVTFMDNLGLKCKMRVLSISVSGQPFDIMLGWRWEGVRWGWRKYLKKLSISDQYAELFFFHFHDYGDKYFLTNFWQNISLTPYKKIKWLPPNEEICVLKCQNGHLFCLYRFFKIAFHDFFVLITLNECNHDFFLL